MVMQSIPERKCVHELHGRVRKAQGFTSPRQSRAWSQGHSQCENSPERTATGCQGQQQQRTTQVPRVHPDQRISDVLAAHDEQGNLGLVELGEDMPPGSEVR